MKIQEQEQNVLRAAANGNSFRYLDVITGLFVAVLLISNVVGQKIWRLGPLDISAAQMLFPVSYIFGDVLTEVYGYARSRRVIWIGFFANILMAVVGWIAVRLPPSPEWPNQQAFAAVMTFVPRMVAASLIAYWSGEFVNSYVMAKMKLFTNGRWLWSRTIGSTVVGQAVDSALVVGITFASVMPLRALVRVTLSIYAVKVVYEVIATPATYLVVNWLKRVEGMDAYDRGTNFSPFAI
ncbi:MAG TPA: queuosine precursor transporter [Bryobacterales bacterium]|nr:queuosine precursor transporter [Bryobacterales bacterium]